MPINKPNNDAEIKLCISKKKYKKAFEIVYDSYSSQIFSYCLSFLGHKDDAEDIFQEVMLKFLTYMKENDIENIFGLLYKIAKNTCLNHLRTKHVIKVELDERHIVSNFDSMETKELNQIIQEALNQIPTEQKEAFILQVYQGLSYKEVAELLDIPLTNVRNRIVRAKRAVREHIKSYQQEERLIL